MLKKKKKRKKRKKGSTNLNLSLIKDGFISFLKRNNLNAAYTAQAFVLRRQPATDVQNLEIRPRPRDRNEKRIEGLETTNDYVAITVQHVQACFSLR